MLCAALVRLLSVAPGVKHLEPHLRLIGRRDRASRPRRLRRKGVLPAEAVTTIATTTTTSVTTTTTTSVAVTVAARMS